MRKSAKTKKDYNSLLDSCISFDNVANNTDDINNLLNYYKKNILMVTYAKLMLKGASLTSKGLEGSVVVFALPVGENSDGEVVFSINEAVVQPDTAKKVNNEIQKIYRNSLKNIPQEERFNTTEKLIISEIKANQEEISKISNKKTLNISDEKYTWNEYFKKFYNTYGYEPIEFNYDTWIEYNTTMIDTRKLKWSNNEKDVVVEQLHNGAREVQGMTMNQLLQPYDLLGIEEIKEDSSIDNEKTIDFIDNDDGYVDVDDDNFDIEAFMQPTVKIDNDYEENHEFDLVKNNYDKSDFRFISGDIDLSDNSEEKLDSKIENDALNIQNTDKFVLPTFEESDDLIVDSKTKNEDSIFLTQDENDNDTLEDDDLASIEYDESTEREENVETEDNIEDLFNRVKCISYDDLVVSSDGIQQSGNIKDKRDIDELFNRLEQNFEKISYKKM